MRDLFNNVDLQSGFDMTTHGGESDFVGNIIDLRGAGGALFTISAGQVQAGTGAFVPRLVHAHANVSSGVPARLHGDIVGPDDRQGSVEHVTFRAGMDNTFRDIAYIGNRRFVQLLLVAQGIPSAGITSFACSCYLYRLRTVPTRRV